MVQGLEFVGGAGFLFHGYQPRPHPSLLAQDMFHRLWNTVAKHCKTTRVLGRVHPEASSLSLEVPLAGLQMSPTDRWVSRRVCVWLCTTWLLYSFTVILSSQLKSFFLPVALWGVYCHSSVVISREIPLWSPSCQLRTQNDPEQWRFQLSIV